MIRAIAFGCTLSGSVLLTCGFAWPPDYADQSRADVATCVEYARYTSPHFEAAVREVDLATGRVDIERNLPRSPEPHPAELATMAGTPPISVIR